MIDRDALAAELFPVEWAQAVRQTGLRARKRRASLRNQAEAKALLIPLREAGQSCASCDNYEQAPFGMAGMICDADSGQGTYTSAVASGLCRRWRARQIPQG